MLRSASSTDTRGRKPVSSSSRRVLSEPRLRARRDTIAIFTAQAFYRLSGFILLIVLSRRLGATDIGTNTVSASFGSQIARSAIYAIVFSLLLVVLYITIRFQWKFAVGAIISLIHDVVVTLGILSFFQITLSSLR